MCILRCKLFRLSYLLDWLLRHESNVEGGLKDSTCDSRQLAFHDTIEKIQKDSSACLNASISVILVELNQSQ